MNIKEAKQIPIESVLAKIYDVYPALSNERELWYCSPFRSEKTPSFKVTVSKNLWIDYGDDRGGTVVDLVSWLSGCSVSEALQKIADLGEDPTAFVYKNSGIFFSPAPALLSAEESSTEVPNLEILGKFKPQGIQLEYCLSRGISANIAVKYLKTIKYRRGEKEYYSIAFGNDKGGYELSAKGFKSCHGSKWYTTIKGVDPKKVTLFEGFFDFLSALEYYRLDSFRGDVIVLNSVSLIKHIDLSNYNTIYGLLDNDTAGDNATDKLRAKYADRFIDQRNRFAGFKDFNDFLKSR